MCRNSGKYKFRQILLFRYERFINFWLRFFDMRRETQFLLCWPYYLTPIHVRRILRCLGSLSVEIKENATTSFNCESQLSTQWQRTQFSMPQWQRTQLSACMVLRQPSTAVFLKPSNSQPISSGHDIIHTPATFPVWGLLWQWWLSYPLRVSVKLYPMAMHLNS